jgi:hypothetical protein
MIGLPKIFYENRLNDATPVASSTATGFDVLNLRDLRAYTWWKANAMPATVTVDCGASKAVDYWGLWGHNLGTLGVTAELRRSTDNFAANDILVDTYAPTNDKPFIRGIASVSFNYWRLRFTGASAPSIAIALLGVAFEFPRRLQRGIDPTGRKVRGQQNNSVVGHSLGKVVEYEEFSEDLRFRHLNASWVDDTFIPLWESHLRGNPYIFSWDPVDHQTRLYLVTSGDDLKTPYETGDMKELGYKISGLVP